MPNTMPNTMPNQQNTPPNLPPCLPQGMSIDTFLHEYWQKKPLLIKGGLPALIGKYEPNDIIELAQCDGVNARLIRQYPKQNPKQAQSDSPNTSGKLRCQDHHWTLDTSPLTDQHFEQLPTLWTLLVQNMEQWSYELGEMWQAFDFIPQWQRDDIMVSYAPVGGSVGKHFDEYDVFLAQGYGTRRWQLGKMCQVDDKFIPNQPIRLLTDMGEIIFDQILEAGDVLYVPPKLSHYGVAMSDSLTFSFGFRRPNMTQLLDNLADVVTDFDALDAYHASPSSLNLSSPFIMPQSAQAVGELSQDSIHVLKTNLIEWLKSEQGSAVFTQSIAELVSRRQYDLLGMEYDISIDELITLLQQGHLLKPDQNSRLIYVCHEHDNSGSLNSSGNHNNHDGHITLYANGQALSDLTDSDIRLLKHLADGKPLSWQQLKELPTSKLKEWLDNGWVWVD